MLKDYFSVLELKVLEHEHLVPDSLEGVCYIITLLANIVCFAAILLFLAISIFGGECWRRDWLMYPNYNYLSWSYGLAVISMFFHGFAAFFVYLVSSISFITHCWMYQNKLSSR
jgi:hypothetical protein